MTERYLAKRGLECAPEKSELLILKARTRGRTPAYVAPDPKVTLRGIHIPQVDSLRVLGLAIHKDGSDAENLRRQVEERRTPRSRRRRFDGPIIDDDVDSHEPVVVNLAEDPTSAGGKIAADEDGLQRESL
ncbi:hypothetical protein HPB50_006773 [Hyalomma asiaticum]|uniref:Uncharacterized protein n=1 Tax=Hyalomma asiaticum TaxID=266040 RepID=A0ACB7S771_HYAAI|nr:hypothetical protein HPB50_006773 [Hyalomma asiaticum]